ncbi:MAG TPA: ATP-binding protein [Candidatus Limnocylindria bacterium]|nr:ATP-binding protein [Candidatus Limnocylindria bacterium]
MNPASPDLIRAYSEYERRLGVERIRIGCYLAMGVLPLGSVVDIFIYHDRNLRAFFMTRLLGSVAMLPLLGVVNTAWGSRFHRVLGVILALIPAGTMAFLIYKIGDATSPYYAGLNLVLLAVGFVLQWTFWQSLSAVGLMLCMYGVLGVWPGFEAGRGGHYFNNFYFLVLTGLIVVVGNTWTSRLRWREFQLRSEVDASRRELEISNRRLMELDQLKGRFFANISHELRTPLTLLLVPLERIAMQPEFQADPTVRELLDTMHANGMRLLKLINDLLDLVRLDAGKMSLHPVPIDVHRFFPGLLQSVRGIAQEKSIQMVCRIDPQMESIRADTDKLEKVFLNLLFNAVKFTSAGGKIELVGRLEDGEAIFEVVDTGVGIPSEQLAYVFERFWQGDSSPQRKYQGAGIGLALVRELVQAHGGRVEASSSPGVGTTMRVRLPLGTEALTESAHEAQARVASTRPPPIAAPEPAAVVLEDPSTSTLESNAGILESLYRRAELFPGIASLRESLRPTTSYAGRKRPKVLVADDEPDMLRFLRMQLADDYEVIEAVDGEQALAFARQYTPEAIVCDMMMPEKDGVQVCQTLRQDQLTRGIPFLMLTARADDETKVQALTAGANDFLTKPFSSAELRLRIKNLVDASDLQRTVLWQNRKLESALEQIKETETQLVQSEKLASLGRLAAGIIHEINNPLNYARTALYVIRQKGADLPEAARPDFIDSVADIEDGLKRVTTIVSDLRGFTHPQGGPVGEVDVSQVVNRMLRMFSAEIDGSVDLEVDIPAGLTVVAEPNRFLQVLVNLVQNALDATKAKVADGHRPNIRLYSKVEDERICIMVRDNGSGIADKNLDKIFEPFFTTKDVGSGTGLGLSICYRIMNEFGGRISVTSEEGEYAEFALEFPQPG